MSARLSRLLIAIAILAAAFALRLGSFSTPSIALPTLQADGTIKDQGIDSAVVLAHE